MKNISSIKIIGVTGTNASGKDTVADYLRDKYEFKNYSLSDEIRFEATRRGLSHERENLRKMGNEIREKFGPNELALRATERILAGGEDKIIVTSVRNPAEIEYLKNNFPNFKLIYVDAPVGLRYERSKARGRVGDGVNLDDFRSAEAKELEGGKTGQQLIACSKLADFLIKNDGSLEELYKKADELINLF